MSKHILSLVFVLAIATMASAVQWVGAEDPAAAGDWNVASNWDLHIPNATDATVKLNNGLSPHNGKSNIIVTSAVLAGVKPQITSVVATLMHLEITGTGSITNTGSFDGYTGSILTTIDAGGVWNSCTTGGSYKMESNTAAGQVNSNTVDVYGTLNVKSTAGSILGMTNDTRSGTSGTNSATVIIRQGGLVDVDSYAMDVAGVQYGTDLIQIYRVGDVTGTFKIKGDASAQVTADALAGRIVAVGGTLNIDTSTGNTIVTVVPEPATLALLGLGGLLLRRKK